MHKPQTKSNVFGPVPSRRLGRSLGIDLTPFKVCTYDCVYCQLGRTTRRTSKRDSYVDPQKITAEIKEHLNSKIQPDVITIAGSGEPTLSLEIGKIIRSIKGVTDIPIVVLTNGSLLWDSSVQEDLLDADIVIPSLDAGDVRLFRHINRPCPEISFNEMLQGLIDFRKRYHKLMWLEIFLLSGLNTVEADVRKLAEWVACINPDKVQLNTVARPPAEDFAMAVNNAQMSEIANMFSRPIDIVADFSNIHGEKDFTASRRQVLDLIRRRPCTAKDVATGLGVHINEAVKHLTELTRTGLATCINKSGNAFYRVSTKGAAC